MMSSDRIDQLMNQAEELEKAGKYEEAITLFEQQILPINRKNVEVLRKIGGGK